MARHTSGYIKSYRKIFDSWIGEDPVTFTIFHFLLHGANYGTSEIDFGGEVIKVGIGQIVTSIVEIAKKFKVDRRTVGRRLQKLQKEGVITQKVTNRGRIITVCNYKDYQCSENASRPSACTATGTATGTLMEEQNNRRTKEDLMDGNTTKGGNTNMDAPPRKKTSQPKKSKIVEYAKSIEHVFKSRSKRFVDFKSLNSFVADFIATHGEKEFQTFADWLDGYQRARGKALQLHLFNRLVDLWKSPSDVDTQTTSQDSKSVPESINEDEGIVRAGPAVPSPQNRDFRELKVHDWIDIFPEEEKACPTFILL